MRWLPTALIRATAGIFVLAWGCGEGTAPPAPVATLQLSSDAPIELVIGGTQLVTAVPKDAKGNALTDRVVTWSSSDSTKATVASGLVTGAGLGTATITASSEGRTSSVEVTIKDGGVVSASGTSFTAQAGAVSVSVPAGAVSQLSSITVSRAANAPANVRLLAGTAFDFGPAGLTFAQPITITLKYNPSQVASDSPESGLQLYEVVGSSWRIVPGSTVNLTAKTVTGAVSKLGTYAVLMQARVATVTISGDAPPIPVVTTRQLVATLKDDEGLTLTRPVAWTSSNTAVLTVDPVTGLATAKIPGSVTVTATSEGKSATATVTVVPGPPAKLLANAGNNQSVAAGAAVPILPSVKVTDAADNPLSGIAVTFAVASGGGTITGASATTNASGVATVGSWTLGTTAGPNTLTATSSAIAGTTVTFQAAGGAGSAANIAKAGGDGQTGTAGGIVATPPSVKVTDANGNVVAGYTVAFAPGGGSGSVTGGSAVTDAAGIARVTSWRLGPTPGPQTLIATGSGLAGSPVTFNATAVAPVASNIAGYVGNNQTARPGFAVPTAPAVIVTDPAGIPVPGATVTFEITLGGGSVTGASATTNAAGIAAVGSWTLGPTTGQNTLLARSGTITGSPVTFNATAVAEPATTIAINAGDGQTARAGAPVPIAPSVKVTDAEGFGVSGFSVAFTIRSGGGSVAMGNAVTNAAGIATVGSWTLGLGGNSLFATAPGLSGSPLIFVALGTADVQIVTFGDSNTDLGFQGVDPSPKVSAYVSSSNPAIRLGPNAPDSPLQLAGKIEARWAANRGTTIKAVNHGISGTSSGAGRNIVFAPNALEPVGGITRFRGEVLGDAYPWSGGEPVNAFYPDGAIARVQAFKPRAASDFGYISIGTNDIADGVSTLQIRNNLEIMIDEWIARGLPANRLMITTLPPRRPSESARIPDLNSRIRTLAQAKGVRLVDISQFVSDGDGLTWKSSSGNPAYPGPLRVTNDELHYSEIVRDWIADQVVSIMLQTNQ